MLKVMNEAIGRTLEQRRFRKTIQILRSSILVDRVWYKESHFDLRNSAIDPVSHYARHGASEGRNPHPAFDTNWYLSHALDAVSSGENPLVHYMQRGAFEGHNPHPLFDTKWYVEQMPVADRTRIDGLTHYLTVGWKANLSPHPLFDPNWYLKSVPDAATMNPLLHFLLFGSQRHARTHELFDPVAYLTLNPSVATSGLPPLVHYLRTGWRLAFKTSDLVSLPTTGNEDPLSAYIRTSRRNPAVSISVTAVAGAHESHETGPANISNDDRLLLLRKRLVQSGLFDRTWYLQKNKDVARAGVDPLDHFLRFGASELRNPGPRFDAAWYVESYPEVSESGLTPIEHYLQIGEGKGYKSFGSYYKKWRERFDTLNDADRRIIADDIAARDLPFLHVIVSVKAANERFLAETLSYIDAQIYRRFTAEIIPSEDCSFETLEVARKFVHHNANCHIGQAPSKLEKNVAYVLAPSGVLPREHAFYLLAREAYANPIACLVYCDEDRIDEDGDPADPVFKPKFSPTLARHTNYIGRCILVRACGKNPATGAITDLGDSSLITESLFNAFLATGSTRVIHIPSVLYHDRAPLDLVRYVPESVIDEQNLPSFSIIIPTRDRLELLQPCIESIESASDYPLKKIEIIVVDNGSKDPSTIDFLGQLTAMKRARVLRDDGGFNFSRLNNAAAKMATNEVLLFLNNDTIVEDAAWLKRIANYVRQKDVGAVGGKLLYPDRTIQHGGVILGMQGVAAHDLVGYEAKDPRARFDQVREISAVTGACLAIRKQVFEEIGGFDEAAAVAFNDTLLCLDAAKAGYRNIYISEPLLLHFESKSRGYDDAPERVELFRREACYARERHNDYFLDDPYYSPNLSLQQPNELAFPPRSSKPWLRYVRKDSKLKILFLSVTHSIGNGVPVVMSLQTKYLANAGHEVYVGGPKGKNEVAYDGCRRIYLDNAAKAAEFAVQIGIDCIVAETPPFFSVARYIGPWPKTLFLDHGEPPPEFFPDQAARKTVLAEKRLCFSMASKIAAISKSVRDSGYWEDASILPNGNSHLLVWEEKLSRQRDELRRRLGWKNKAVVLNVCRFRSAERRYKGLDTTAEVLREFKFLRPRLAKNTVFVLCGAAEPEDVADMQRAGFEVFANITDTEMREFYLAADIYLNMSRWEGYNLGIGQALALGLPVVASDISAHRAFPVFTSSETLPVVEHISALVEKTIASGFSAKREPFIQDWEPSLRKLELEILELCRSSADNAAEGDQKVKQCQTKQLA